MDSGLSGGLKVQGSGRRAHDLGGFQKLGVPFHFGGSQNKDPTP